MTGRWRSRSRASRRQGPDSIVKNTASSFAAQMTTASLTAVLTVFLVRALGAKQYGLFALTLGMSAIAIAFADLGISTSTARFVAEHRGRDAELRALVTDALKLKVVITGLACALLAALASVIADAYGNPELVWPLRAIALATFGQSTLFMLLGVSTALGRTVVNVRLVAAESLLEISASVALVLAGAGAAGAALGRAIGYLVGAVIAAVVVLRLGGDKRVGFWRLPRLATVRRVGGYARSVFAIDVSFTLSGSLSVLFLGAYAGSAASGMFQAPLKLIVLLQYIGLSTANGVAPRLTRGPGQEPDVRALNGALRGLIGFQCLLLAPAVVWAGPITHVLLGAGYSQSADVLAVLAPYIFFSGLAPLVTLAVTYLGEAGRRVPISFATLALVAAGGFILIPSHGVVGAAIATDIAFGFYTLAHIWLCRRLLKLRIGMLLWSLACGLTAAAAMGIVLESVGTKHLTILDWLEGGAGGFAAYVGMLIFTREIRGAHIARAGATIGGILARLRVAAGKRRTPPPAMLPLRPEAVAPTEVGASAWDDAIPADPPFSSTAVAESTDWAPAGAAAPIDRVEAPTEPSTGADEPRVRDRRRARTDTKRRAFRGALGRRRSRPAVARPPAPVRSDVEVGEVARDRRSPAASPPRWVEGQLPEPAALVEASAPQSSPAAQPPGWVGAELGAQPMPRPPLQEPGGPVGADPAVSGSRRHDPGREVPFGEAAERGSRAGDRDHGKPRAPLAAQPPAWLSDRSSSDQAGSSAPAVVEDSRPRAKPFGASPDLKDTSGSPTDVVYQIAWRPGEDTGVFELCPVEPSDRHEVAPGVSPATEQSPSVAWGWRVAPAPIPAARRAHAALVARLLAAGWRRAGSGDAWFADRFKSPDRADPDEAQQRKT